MSFNIQNWYWIVGGDDSRVWSSASRAFVSASDQTYAMWLAAGSFPTRIASMAELNDVLFQRAPEMVPSHPKNVIAALDQTDLVALRCFKAGVEFPSEWKDYTAVLRDMVTAPPSDQTRPLPARPAYPAGT